MIGRGTGGMNKGQEIKCNDFSRLRVLLRKENLEGFGRRSGSFSTIGVKKWMSVSYERGRE